ncbi:MAG: sigma-54-dependent Fis family transcriptional regulator [Deltaproteobacteria bacterium]|nr:sigma-54-dependent Fis family transcriptional regulator [Deltaproteobacteria bacterium]
MAQVLVVDDETSIREFLEIFLKRAGHTVRLARDVTEAILRFKDEPTPDLVLTDLRLPRGSGLDVLQHVVKASPGTQVVMMTAFATTETAVEAMRLGAYDYIIKPFKVDELAVVIERALERRQLRNENRELKATLDARAAHSRLIGTSPTMKEVFELIAKVAPTRTTVLLTGESGTGKELVARAIHARGPRTEAPFVAVNCGAIPETLIESELFGHTKGSFTGAHADRPGLFELGGQGTVFLDEIGELPLAMQVKLLRVLQERKLRRVGGAADLDVECRVIAATNRDLESEIQKGRFREDLYFRLNVIQIALPALRERRQDIPMLTDAFIGKFAEQQQSRVRGTSREVMQTFMAWHWPGNVRELENVIERGVTLASGELLDVEGLPLPMRGGVAGAATPATAIVEDVPVEGLDLESVLEAYERRLLERALARTGGRKKKAAELLRVSFRSFRYRLAKLGLSGGDDDPADEV